MEERKMRPRPRRSRRKVCKFCVEKATGIDYKDIKKLTGFINMHIWRHLFRRFGFIGSRLSINQSIFDPLH